MELATIRADNPVELPRRRRAPKGPNPLSMKKKAVPRARQPILTSRTSDEADPVTGQKRGRGDVEEDPIAPAARKRKRRRKHGSSEALVNDSVPQILVPT